jgi:hypothetical protein
VIRASIGEQEYWDLRVSKDIEWISKANKLLAEESKNPSYDPQFSYDLSLEFPRLILRRYSRGDNISELPQYFSGLLDTWELSNKLAAELNAPLESGQGWDHRHLVSAPLVTNDSRGHNDPRSWVFSLSDLNHYNWCFWLVGLALSLEIPDDQWQRLIALIGGEGEDVLLDRIIASRQANRKIGAKLLHKKPYARLLKAIDAPQDQQAVLLRDFVEHWYTELARKGKNELWWYIYGDPEKHPLEMGSYFGRWCIEAVAAVKAFGLDDSLCLGHEHYPGDLLRPNEPTTHPIREEMPEKKGFFKRWLR